MLAPVTLRVAIVGDYRVTNDTHRSTSNEFEAAGVQAEWVSTDSIRDADAELSVYDGVVIAPGSPYASTEGALAAIRYAREEQVPLVGTCGGFQHIVLELVRNVVGIRDAEHAETAPDAARLAIVPLSCTLKGTRGEVQLSEPSRAASLYRRRQVTEPFFCSYGLDAALEPELQAAGLRVTGRSPDGDARVVELEQHPFFVGTLYVFQARESHRPLHPLTQGFLAAAEARAAARALA